MERRSLLAGAFLTLSVIGCAGRVLEPVSSAPAIQGFTASPGSVVPGGGATLSVSYSGGNGTIDNGVGAIASGASVTVSPAATTTYTLTVANLVGERASSTVTVTVSAPPPAVPAIQAFTAVPAGIAPGGSSTLSVTYSGGAGAIDNGVGAIASGASVSVQPAATTTYTLTVSDGAGHTATKSVTVTVTAVPLPAIQSFTASAAGITAGGSSTLSAAYSGGSGTIGNGVGAIASGGSVSVSPAATTTYTLTVSDGAGHTATKSVTVTVVAAPVVQSFAASPVSIGTGSSSALSATYTGGAGTVDNGVGAIASGGSVAVRPGTTTTYTLTVANSLGTKATLSVTVTVAALPAVQGFTGNPASITAGGSSTLSATYSGGSGTIDNGVGTIASGGSVSVKPAATTTYTLTVSDGAGHTATKSVTITVVAAPAIQSFTASPGSINTSLGSTLAVTYTGGTGAIDNGVGAIASGASVAVTPGTTTTYTLTVTNSLGQKATQSVTVTVVPLPSIQSFTASPAGISAGGSSTLSATYSGGTGVIDNGVGAIASGGSVSVKPGATTTYTLTASDAAGHSATSSLTVTVGTGSLTDLMPADRLTTWNPGMMAVGGIPARTAVCATVNASSCGNNGAAEASACIQAAIDGCPAGQVVQLSAGTFTINSGNYLLVNKGITLRGAGPAPAGLQSCAPVASCVCPAGATCLRKTNGAQPNTEAVSSTPSPLIIVGPSQYSGFNDPKGIVGSTNLTADAAKGLTSVTVASAAGLSAGQFVLLDEASGAGWQTDPQGRGQVWASPDFRVVWQKHNPALPGIDDFAAAEFPTTPNTAGSWFSRLDRPTAELKQIASISGTTVTFTTPIHISYRTSHAAQLSSYGPVFVTNAGVEDLTMIGGDNGNLRFNWAAQSWARNVENTVWHDEGFSIENSFRIEIRDFFVHDAAWAQPGGGGYAISLAQGSAEVLIENGISVRANKVMVSRSSGAGSVVGYNYMDMGYINSNGAWIEIGLNASHMVGPHHVLFEGNYAFNADSDDTHGNSIYHTFYRNHLRGIRAAFANQAGGTVDDASQPGNGPRRCGGLMAYSYWMSFIGNVLGAPGAMSGWTYETSFASGVSGIWMLGWDGVSPYPTDAKVGATAIRHGNFDYVTSSVKWDPTITARTLPSSLYLSLKPAFFNAGIGYTWPWVDPLGADDAHRIFKLPAKARYDAGTPFKQP